jgi:hypothetical protein
VGTTHDGSRIRIQAFLPLNPLGHVTSRLVQTLNRGNNTVAKARDYVFTEYGKR